MDAEQIAFSYNETRTTRYLDGRPLTSTTVVRPYCSEHECRVHVNGGPNNFKDPTNHSWEVFTQVCTKSREIREYGTYPNGNVYTMEGRNGSTTGVDGRIGGTNAYPLPHAGLLGRAQMLAITQARLFSKYRSESEILVDAAEWKQTKELVRSSADLKERVVGLVKTVNGELRKGLNRRQRALEYATTRWLELRYGVIPLIGSVESALDALGKRIVESPIQIVETFRNEYSLADSYTRSGEFSHPVKVNVTGTERMRLSYLFLPPGAGVWNYTSFNPAVVAWELIPLSFVADWILKIGDNLRYMDSWNLMRIGFINGYSSYSVLENQRLLCFDTRAVATPSNLVYRCNRETWEGETTRQYKALSRVVHTSLPYGRPPLLRITLGANQALDSLSLTHVFLRDNIRRWSR